MPQASGGGRGAVSAPPSLGSQREQEDKVWMPLLTYVLPQDLVCAVYLYPREAAGGIW